MWMLCVKTQVVPQVWNKGKQWSTVKYINTIYSTTISTLSLIRSYFLSAVNPEQDHCTWKWYSSRKATRTLEDTQNVGIHILLRKDTNLHIYEPPVNTSLAFTGLCHITHNSSLMKIKCYPVHGGKAWFVSIGEALAAAWFVSIEQALLSLQLLSARNTFAFHTKMNCSCYLIRILIKDGIILQAQGHYLQFQDVLSALEHLTLPNIYIYQKDLLK